MSYGVSNETAWNSDAYDTKNAKILPKISISLDPPTKGSKRVDVLKCLGATSWGESKEHLLTTAKAIVFLLFDFSAPLPKR